jgi:hypothetical protein
MLDGSQSFLGRLSLVHRGHMFHLSGYGPILTLPLIFAIFFFFTIFIRFKKYFSPKSSREHLDVKCEKRNTNTRLDQSKQLPDYSDHHSQRSVPFTGIKATTTCKSIF